MKRALSIGLALAIAVAAFTQETRTIDGRKHIVHVVQAGQTLYAIARSHAVPVDALLKANPAAAGGLSIGQVLLIPSDAVVKKELRAAPRMLSGELVHTVKKKETLFGIARSYGVDQQELIARNPELKDGVREGAVVIIPLTRITGVNAEQLKPASADGATLHEVKPGETLYAIGRQYGVTPEAIQSANGGLPLGLKAGTTLRIPIVAPVATPRLVAADSVSRKQRYKVTYLLPYSIDRNEQVLADPEAKGYDEYTRIAAQFCGGAMLALDTMKARGLQADVHFLDTGTEPGVWSALWKRPEVRGTDLFIGPFHRSAIEELTRQEKDAHVVCPVQQSNKVLLGHPNVSKVISSRPDQVQQLMRYVAVRHGADNVIFCKPEIPAEKELQEQALRALYEARTAAGTDSIPIARPGRRDINDLQGRLDAGRTNVIVMPSEDVETVGTLITKLAALSEKYPIVLFGLSGWLDMANVDPSDMGRVDLHLPASTWIDHSDPRVIAFVKAYRLRFNTEPDEYAFLGYDVSCYYLTALQQEGARFAMAFDRVACRPLHMRFHMTRAGMENGWRNDRSEIVHVKGSTILRAE